MNTLINSNNKNSAIPLYKKPNSVSFKSDKKQTVTISHNQRNINDLLSINNQFLSITKEIGGLKDYNGIPDGIILAKARIADLSRETQKAWDFNPTVLKEKMDALKGLSGQLDAIQELYDENSNNITKEKSGLYIPNKPHIIVDPGEAAAIYNQTIKGKPLTKKMFSPTNFTTTEELRHSLSDISDKNWDYRKLNLKDSQLYKKFKGQLLLGENKKIVKEQITTLDKHIDKLKKEGFTYSSETHLKVYDAEVTGKILALETAKLRRTTLFDTIVRPEYDKNLERPNILIQPTPNSAPMVFKIDTQFTPKKYELLDAVNKNSDYKPIVKKLFPKGLPLYVVPGYMDEKMGNLNGGESIPHSPDSGIWLNSYDIDNNYQYMSNLETIMAKSRGVEPFKSSVLDGNMNRARTLAHEIGHVIAYKTIENDAVENKKEGNHFILSSSSMNFMEGWSGLRINSKTKLNGDEINPRSYRGMDEVDKRNLEKYVDYESVAEDIRMAVTGDKIPASSKMTGIYDQSKEGRNDFKKVIYYVKEYFINNKKPAEIITKLIKTEK